MESHEKFKQDRYVHVKNLLTQEECKESISVFEEQLKKKNFKIDYMCPYSFSFANAFWNLQSKKQEMFEDILKLKLIPTYNYSRIYKPGEVLLKHIDRYACEISVTITLDYDNDIWPIYFLDRFDSSENIYYYLDKMAVTKNSLGDACFSPFMDTSNKLEFKIEKGDGVFYRGCELVHWREKYVEGREQIQVFFHYVNANGPYRDLNFNKQSYNFGVKK